MGNYNPQQCYDLGVNAVMFVKKQKMLPIDLVIGLSLARPVICFLDAGVSRKSETERRKALVGIRDDFYMVFVTAETFKSSDNDRGHLTIGRYCDQITVKFGKLGHKGELRWINQ